MTTTDNAATIARLSAELDAIRVAYYAPDMSVLDGCRFTAEQTGKYVTMTTAFGRDGSIVGRDSNGAEGIAQGVWWKRLQTVEHALSVARNGGGQPTAHPPHSIVEAKAPREWSSRRWSVALMSRHGSRAGMRTS